MKVQSKNLTFNKYAGMYTGNMDIAGNVPMSITVVSGGGIHSDYNLAFETPSYAMYNESAKKRNLKGMKIFFK